MIDDDQLDAWLKLAEKPLCQSVTEGLREAVPLLVEDNRAKARKIRELEIALLDAFAVALDAFAAAPKEDE